MPKPVILTVAAASSMSDALNDLGQKTDALGNSGVRIIGDAPEESHPPVSYPIALVKSSTHLKEAQTWEDFTLSVTGQAVFAKYGFLPDADQRTDD